MFKGILGSVLLMNFAVAAEHKNPVLQAGGDWPDGKIGAFKQHSAGDCFFLAAVIAMANDPEGLQLVEKSLKVKKGFYQVTFPNVSDKTWSFNYRVLTNHTLTNGINKPTTVKKLPSTGDLDIRILEVAADQYWKASVKKEGLWDDVPMNAFHLFSSSLFDFSV